MTYVCIDLSTVFPALLHTPWVKGLPLLFTTALSGPRTAHGVHLEALSECVVNKWINEWMGVKIHQMDQLN